MIYTYAIILRISIFILSVLSFVHVRPMRTTIYVLDSFTQMYICFLMLYNCLLYRYVVTSGPPCIWTGAPNCVTYSQ